MSTMKNLFMKRNEIIEEGLKSYYNDLIIFKTPTDAIYRIEKIVEKLQKEKILLIEYTLNDYLNLMQYIDNCKAISTLLEGLDVPTDKNYLDKGYLQLQQKEYFKQITKILQIEEVTNYIEMSIQSWQIEYKDFTATDIENLVEYAMEKIEY